MESSERKFERLYERNHRDIYRFIYRHLPDESAAADLLQDTFINFIKIFKHRELPPEDQCRMYLFRSARNLIINYRKSYYSRNVTQFSFTEAGETAFLNGSASAEEDYVRNTESEYGYRLMENAMQSLSEKERSALILRYNEGYSLESLASVIGVSTATAHRLVKKAERKISEKIRTELQK